MVISGSWGYGFDERGLFERLLRKDFGKALHRRWGAFFILALPRIIIIEI